MNKVLMFLILTIAIIGYVIADDVNTTANVENDKPFASSAELNSGTDITLTSGTTTEVTGTAIITDPNGCDELQAVDAILYRTSLAGGVNASDDGRNHYTATCVSQGDCVTTTETYHCVFDVEHYADPTDTASAYDSSNWTFWVMPDDGEPGIPDTDQQEMSTLTSMSVNTFTVAFGTLSLGSNTSDVNQYLEVENYGNEPLDVELSGYGSSGGDGYCMTCTTGNVDVGYMEYSSRNFTYGGGTGLQASARELDFDLDRGTDADDTPLDNVRWGLGFPASGISGSCTGTVTITAVSDPLLD